MEVFLARIEQDRHERRCAWISAYPRDKPLDQIDPDAFARWDGTPLKGGMQDLMRKVPLLRGRRVARQMRDKGITEEEAVRLLKYPEGHEYTILPQWLPDYLKVHKN